MRLRLARLPTLLDYAISYLLFATYFTVMSFEAALLEAASRLSRLGLGKLLVKLAAMFAVDRRAALREALRRNEFQPLTIAYLDEQNGVSRQESLRGLEVAILQSLSRASRQVDIFVAICQLTLYLGMISLVLPLIGAMIGYGLAIELGYIMQIISIFMIYLFQICGLVLSNVTEFPRTDYVMLLLALAIGVVTYFTTGSIGTACLLVGILSILFTFRNYLLHVATLRSLPMRVRYSFNALMSGSPIYYPGKIDNVLDHIFETIHRSAREVGTAESIALTYRLADHVLTTIQNLRSTLRMIGLASLGLMIGIVTCMHWMLTATAGLGITMKYTGLGLMFTRSTIMSIDKLLALALAVNCFLSGKIMDNEHLGMYLQTIAGIISLALLHV